MSKYSISIDLESERDIRLVVTAAEAISNTNPDWMPYAVEIQTAIERMIDNLREVGGGDSYEGWIMLADSLTHRGEELNEIVADSFRSSIPEGEQH